MNKPNKQSLANAKKPSEMQEAYLYFRKESLAERKQARKDYIEQNKKMLDLYMKEEIDYYDEVPAPKKSPPKPSTERMLSFGTTKKSGGSHMYYCWVWSVAQREFRQLLAYERKRTGIISSDRKEVFTELADFYFLYVRLYKVMDEVYDQIAHPQKRILVRELLDFLILRLMDIKNTLVALENSEYIYFDEIAQERNWTADETAMGIPRYYFYDQDPGVKEREGWMNEIHNKGQLEEVKEAPDEEVGVKKRKKYKEPTLTVGWSYREIILTIQKYERYRQAMEDYRFMQFLSEDEAREAAKKKREKERENADKDKAATILQKLVRGYLARKYVQKQRMDEATFLGLSRGGETIISGGDDKCKDVCPSNQKKLELLLEKRRKYRRTLEDLYQKSQVLTENRIRTFEAPEMAEKLSNQLRKWMINIREKTGKLPEIPKSDHGGIAFLTCPSKLPLEVLEKRADSSEPDSAKKKKKDKKKGADKKKKDASKVKAKDKKRKGAGPQPLALGPPQFLQDMIKCNREYNSLWRLKDEKTNPEQSHEEFLVTKEKRKLVLAEVRQQVDNVLRAELVILKQALDGKKGKKKGKGKKGQGKGKGKKGKGKGKKGKKGKKKKGKDLTPDRTFRSLYEDMVSNNLIREYPKQRLQDMFGGHSLVNGTIRNYWMDRIVDPNQDQPTKFTGDANPLPSLGDVKSAIKDIVVLPMGSPTIHAMGPFNKSLLIAGPAGVGKKSLVYAICTEIGAALIDLTATNIVGKYPGKPGLTMLVHLVNKVGRLAQPTIVLIDGVEKMYQKRVPKTDKSEPKRLKKQIGKFLKAIGPEDRIMLIGLSSEPWLAPMKPLKKDFQKMVYIPRPDYGVRVDIWKTLLQEHKSEISEDVSVTLLAKLSDGWTYNAIKKAVAVAFRVHKEKLDEEDRQLKLFNSNVLNLYEAGGKRIRIGKRLVKADDLLEALGEFDPMFLEQDKAWLSWWNKTPQMKLRIVNQMGGGATKGKKGKKEGKKKSKKK